MSDNEQDEIITEFLVEAHENLDALDRELLALEKNPTAPDLLASVFRRVHTVKGACGFLGFAKMETVAHASENLLSKIREEELELTPTIITALLAVADTMRGILRGNETNGTEGDEDYSAVVENINRLQRGEAPVAAPPAPAAAAPSAAATAKPGAAAAPAAGDQAASPAAAPTAAAPAAAKPAPAPTAGPAQQGGAGGPKQEHPHPARTGRPWPMAVGAPPDEAPPGRKRGEMNTSGTRGRHARPPGIATLQAPARLAPHTTHGTPGRHRASPEHPWNEQASGPPEQPAQVTDERRSS